MRVAIVTGAARGIGAAIAHRLAADGMSIGVVDLDEQGSARTVKEIVENGGRAIPIGADVADERAAANAVQQTAAELGPVSVLINSAGIIRDNLIFKMSASDWDSVIDVHLRGAFLMTRAAQIHMTQAGWGRIVNISSSSTHSGQPFMAPYVAAKSAVNGLTKSLALEYGPMGVTVNAVPPGFIDTPMLRKAEDRGFLGDTEKQIEQTPVRRMGKPEDIAAACAFFISEEASYITGQILGVNGGRNT